MNENCIRLLLVPVKSIFGIQNATNKTTTKTTTVTMQWVADGSPTHSSAIRIETPLQFVPAGTNPKEFKKLQQLVSSMANIAFILCLCSFFHLLMISLWLFPTL